MLSPVRRVFIGLFLLMLAWREPAFAQVAATSQLPASARFNQELLALTSATQGVVGVALRDLSTGEEFSVNGERLFSQAGLSKIHVLAAFLRASDAGKVDLNEPHTLSPQDKLPGGILQRLGDRTVTMSLRDYASLMVATDDNSATNIILSRIGVGAVNDTLSALGSADIRFAGLITDPQNPEDNLASPCALVRCLAALHRGQVLTPASRDEYFSMLSTPRAGPLRNAVPRHIRVASKSGIRGALRCTAGIVYLKNHPYVITVMTQPPADDTGTDLDYTATISAISRLSYSYFSKLDPKEPSAPKTSSKERP
ncbi:MAG: serine hydrolase [Nibricoccus sp.]